MADSDTQIENVDVDTDNLDDFSDTFFGKAKVAEPEVEDVEEVSETPSATEEVEESTVDEADGDDAPADDEDEDEKPSQAKGRKSARERIDELTAKARQAERRADAAERELAAAKVQTPANEKEVRQAPEALDTGAPTPDDVLENGDLAYPLGEFDPKYIRDLTRFTIRQENEVARKEDEQARQNEALEQEERVLVQEWTVKLNDAAERLPDFREKVAELEDTFSDLDPNYGKYLATTIMSLEFGPEVLDYLADHPDEAQTIVAAGPTRATIALGRIEARFASGDEVEKGKVVTTQAPPPPPKNKGSHGKVSVAADTDDLDAFEKQFFSKK